ncbi:MAG: hypothetical protein ACRCV0_02050 [Brevinema sp.]
MIIAIWKSLGLFYEPRKTITKLLQYSPNYLLKMGIILSFVALLATNIGSMLDRGILSSMILLKFVPYYVLSFIFLSVIISIYAINHSPVSINKILGIYLLMDFPFIVVFPLMMIGFGIQFISPLIGILIILVYFYSFYLKLLSLSLALNLSISKLVLLILVPFVFLLVSSVIGIFELIQYFF